METLYAAAANMSERQPLLVDQQTTQRYDGDNSNENLTSKHLIDFDPNGDPENPREWPSAFKWTLVSLLACMAFTV